MDIPVSVNHVSLKQIGSDKEIYAYPNPIKAGTQLQFKGLEKGRLTWIDVTGKIWNHSHITEHHVMVPEGLPIGLYFIKIEDANTHWTGKIWIE